MSTRRKNIMLGTAGHVDHGKSALVKALTGCDTDTLAEEKERGLTIDLGFAPCRMSDERIVGVVDVPGHVDFIRNMVAGAHGIDVVIFVVAADDGVMPQTREHLNILALMGLRHGLVALTKIDLVDVQMRELVVEDARSLLAGTFLADAPICPISNVTGEGFDGFFDALDSMVNACDERPCSGLFRAWVADVFPIRGSGTVITGIPSSGLVRPGDRLFLQPSGQAGRVRHLEVYGEDALEGRAGECVALNVPEFDRQTVRRGMVLSASDAIPPAAMVEGELRILPDVKGAIDDYAEVHFHIGTASVPARVAMLEADRMEPGQTCMVQLRLAEPLAVVPGERFIVRANVASRQQSGLATIGGGRILGVSNVRLRRKRPWVLESLAARRVAIDDPDAWCELMLRESGKPLALEALASACNARAEQVRELVEKLRTDGGVLTTDRGALFHRDLARQTAAKLLEAIRAFHDANPRRAGIEREELFAKVGGDHQLLELAALSLIDEGTVKRAGPVLAVAGWDVTISAADQRLCAETAAALLEAGWSPPPSAELAEKLDLSVERLEEILQLLIDQGLVVRLDERVVVHRQAVEKARMVALGLFRRGPSFSTMDFRDALGVSRKYAVPLLDYLDALRFTVRDGHNRTPGAEAKKLLASGQ